MTFRKNIILNTKEEVKYIKKLYFSCRNIYEVKKKFNAFIEKGNYLLYKSEADIKNINKLIVDILSQTEKKNTLLKPYQIDYIERKYFTSMFFDFFDIEYSVLKYLRNEVENCNSFKIDFNMFIMIIMFVIVPFVVLYSTFYIHFDISNTFHITSLILFAVTYLTVMSLIFHKSRILDIIDIILKKLYRYVCLFYIKSDIHLLNVEKNNKELDTFFNSIKK